MELGVRKQCCGKMTIRREDLEFGFEPDNCYYIQNLKKVIRKKGELNFRLDPPPDLAVEVEKSRSSSSKMLIYQRFQDS